MERSNLGASVHAARRRVLMSRVDSPVLLMGNNTQPRNLLMNKLPFRQDSTFLYYTGCSEPGAAVLINGQEETLFLPIPGEGDELWHGPHPSLKRQETLYGINIKDRSTLESSCANLALDTLATSDPQSNAIGEKLSGRSLIFGRDMGPPGLVGAIIEQRRRKSSEEISQLRIAAKLTSKAHIAAMKATRPGVHEEEIAAVFKHEFFKVGAVEGYHSIVTVDGDILHNPYYKNTLTDGDLLLLDGGAEVNSGYCCDVTRTWPVSGTFTPMQRSAYQAVLEAHHKAVSMCRQGVRYRDIHLASVKVIAQWLIDENIIYCGLDEAVETGVAALFYPHGVGHLLGLDVHDLEAFGDKAAYAEGRGRSKQFGLGALRMDIDLEPGHVVTIEPGFYVVDAILRSESLAGQHEGRINRAVIEKWRGFGGIRLEDDILVTDDEPENLTLSIPIEINDVEETVGTLNQGQ